MLAIALEEILNHGFETLSAPASFAATLRRFTFCVAAPAVPLMDRARLSPDVPHERTCLFGNKAVTICPRREVLAVSPIRRFGSYLSVLSASSVVAGRLKRAVL